MWLKAVLILSSLRGKTLISTMEMRFFPGKGTSFKRYSSYFPTLRLSKDAESSIVLCHSKGIEDALQLENVHVVAMDPSMFPIRNEKVFIWARKGRIIPLNVLNITLYEEQTHHPYQIKRLRDQIVRRIDELQ